MYGAVAGITAFGTLSGLAATAAHATSSVTYTSLAGTDRYQTAGLLTAKAFPAGVTTVVLADAIPGHQSDALAASGYAGVNGDGVILTDNTSTVPANTLTALSNNKVKNIVVMGGTAAVSAAQVSQLTAAGYTVTEPFQGANRFQTMQLVDDSMAGKTGTTGSPAVATGILASGDDNHLVDALAGGGLAFADKLPVILTESSSSTLEPEAQSVITTLGIKKLIVLGGTASIPASQYTPMPTGVTSLDTSATTGADRSATSELLEKDEVANYGASNTSLSIAAGATFVGTTTNVQNDGADALSGAPFTGHLQPTCVTDGPTNAGVIATCGSDLAATLVTINGLSGPSSLTPSQSAAVVSAAGGTATTSANPYTVSAPSPSATPPASTAAAPSQGATTYTASGLPTASGTIAQIALFPCSGTAQANNGPVNGAPATSSSGSTTFTAPGGTSPVGGNAIGEGTTSSGGTGTLSTGSVAGGTSTAYIASVNGVPTAAGAGGAGPTVVNGVTVSNGTVSFVVNSFQLDCEVPVIYTAPSSAGSKPALLVNANGTPQTGYAVGAGGLAFWSAPPAPATGGGYVVQVVLAPPLSGASSFDGQVLGCVSAAGVDGNAGLSGSTVNCPAGAGVTTFAAPSTPGSIFSFNIGTAGSTFHYTDNATLTETNFASYLSSVNTGNAQPNSSPTVNNLVQGDQVDVGFDGANTAALSSTVTGYTNGAAAAFAFDSAANAADTPGYGDIPAAPSNVAANYNGCAFTVAGACKAAVAVTWTAPTNPDVSGSEATAAGGAGFSAANGSYQIWRSTDTNGKLGAASQVNSGNLTVVPGSDTADIDNGNGNGPQAATGGATSVSSPTFWDTSTVAGQQYVYYVTAKGASGVNGENTANPFVAAGPSSPFSTGSTPVSAGAGAGAPVIDSVTINSGSVTCTGGCIASGTATTGTPGYALVYYNEAVSCGTSGAAGPDFAYSNSGGAPTNVKGSTCQQGPSGTSLQINFPATFQSGTNGTGGPIFSADVIAQPGVGDTYSYTPPSTPTTQNAVFATGTASSPVYEAAQTVTDNGNPTPTSNSGTTTSPSNPLS